MGRKRKNNTTPKVHPELEGLDLRINEFGEMVSNIDVNKINEFLTRTVPDKKLINRHDNAYQQEFKENGVEGVEDDEDLPPYVEESEEDEDDFESIIGVDDKTPPEKD